METISSQPMESPIPFYIEPQKPAPKYDAAKHSLPVNLALAENLIETKPAACQDNIPQVLVNNNSSWPITIFTGEEIIGKTNSQHLSITITLQPNASAVIPSFFMASHFFYDEGRQSIHQYLHSFPAHSSRAGLTIRRDNQTLANRPGSFPLQIEINYNNH